MYLLFVDDVFVVEFSVHGVEFGGYGAFYGRTADRNEGRSSDHRWRFWAHYTKRRKSYAKGPRLSIANFRRRRLRYRSGPTCEQPTLRPPMPLADTLLRLAAGRRLFLHKWSDRIMLEVTDLPGRPVPEFNRDLKAPVLRNRWRNPARLAQLAGCAVLAWPS